MKTGRILSALIIVFFLSGNTYAQNLIKGSVINEETKEPIIGAYILAFGTRKGTTTNLNGKFEFEAMNKIDSLLISYNGFNDKIIKPNSVNIIGLKQSSTQINQVVISASRESQSREEVPLSITAISAKDINETKATSIEQILNKVNGVYMVDLGNEQHSMSIRQPLSYSGMFLYLEDGIPIRTTGVFNHNALIEINMASVNGMEIIKGPASSLYGSQAIGGAVNFITHKPTLVPTVKAQIQGNNLGYKRTDFVVSNTWKKVGLVFSGYGANRSNGPRDHSDFNKLALTLRKDVQLAKNTLWTSTVSYVDYNTDMTGGLDSTNFYSQDFSSLHSFTYRSVKALRAKSTISNYWSKKSKSSLTAFFRDNKIGQNPHYRIKDDYKPWLGSGNPLLAHGQENINSFKSYGAVAQHMQRLNFLNLKWISGASIDFSPNDYKANYISIDKNPIGLYTGYEKTDSLLADYKVGLLNTALYTQIELSPLKNLKFVAALRYDRIDYDYDNSLDSTAFSGAPDEKNGFDYITPKIGATYDFEKGRGMYANYSIGFSPPDVSELYRGVSVPILKPSTFKNHEVGGWFAFHKKKGYFELALYQLSGTNEIINVQQDDGSFEKENAGATLHQGIEYTLKYSPVKSFSIRISGVNAKHTFVDFLEEGDSYNGNQMNAAPSFIGNTEIIYRPNFLKGSRVGLEWQHLGKYFLDAKNTEEYPGFNLVNLRIGYKIKSFNIWLNILNLANQNYATIATKSAWGKSYRVGNPRTFNLGISYRFSGKKQQNKLDKKD